MKIECPECKAVHKIEEAKIPDNGAYAKCRECKTRFFIKKNNSSATLKENSIIEQNDLPKEIVEEDKKCPHCGCERKQTDDTCPMCGIVYKKYVQKKQCPNPRCKADRNLKDKRCPICSIYYEDAANSLKNKSKKTSTNTNPKLIECSVCGKLISKTAENCPHCGESFQSENESAPIIGIVSICLGLASVLMPYFAAVFLVPTTIICSIIAFLKGQKRLGSVATLLGVMGFFGIIYTSNKITSITNSVGKNPSEIVLPQSIASAPPIVTKSEYNKIRNGMSYFEVRSIIGASGEELSRSEIADIVTVMYSWKNSNGSNMNAMFQNDKLVNKAQFGLP